MNAHQIYSYCFWVLSQSTPEALSAGDNDDHHNICKMSTGVTQCRVLLFTLLFFQRKLTFLGWHNKAGWFSF